MDRKNKKGQKGFTLIELIMTMVVMGILFTIPAVRMPDVWDGLSAKNRNAKKDSIRSVWLMKKNDNSRTSPGNPWPTLQDVSAGNGGTPYSPGASNPGAPATLPAKIEYFWKLKPSLGKSVGAYDASTDTMTPSMPKPTTYSCGSDINSSYLYGGDWGLYYSGWWNYGWVYATVNATLDGGTSVADAGSAVAVPRCKAWVIQEFHQTAGNWASPETAAPVVTSGWASNLIAGGFDDGLNVNFSDHFVSANVWRYNCASVAAGSGATYVISIAPAWDTANGQTTSRYYEGTKAYAPNQYPASTATCVNKSGVIAPFNNPGTEGTFKLATDFSGFCVATGYKVRTYKDAAGTQPTTAYTDKVKRIDSSVVADAARCP